VGDLFLKGDMFKMESWIKGLIAIVILLGGMAFLIISARRSLQKGVDKKKRKTLAQMSEKELKRMLE
jgi:hypothetical protein